ncbi:tyrosine-type recombinase/integrase [Shewanella acanthi]|uniref:tyrosine-type recombinase/integrase n=1 Tax=Shewanella acanthi TaxID=2864212 RepID=UPI001C655F1B|nr:site-specific integrase [Shewanella acanthi]QYJ79936.1 site-specific integrase [Shewanella acanthi]
MAQIRVRPNGRIQFDLSLYGRRFREGTKMLATPKNLNQAKATLKQMNAEIDLGTFQYRDYFPGSKKIALFESLQRERHPDRQYPFFDVYAQEWFDRQKAKWKSSYQSTVRNTLDRYLIPQFGNCLISEISLSQVEFYRETLMQEVDPKGEKKLSSRRINGILWPLVAILSLAADELEFRYPLRRYKALREERADSHPMTLLEVNQFLAAVTPEWRDYFVVRFWTGMRSCEVHGLVWDNIDFNHRLIRIRQNWVNGEACAVKTPKSRRELRMCDTLFDVFSRLKNRADKHAEYVFTHQGIPLDTHFVSKKLWFPTLLKAGLRKRRPYETRHTAAVLHIAAHENPLYISQMLGHSDTKLLFNVYAPYVANASRLDGLAFSQMMNEGPIENRV